jgi:hypothetical protein
MAGPKSSHFYCIRRRSSMSTYNYSIDFLTATVFEKELTNILNCSNIVEGEEIKKLIIEYMERRIKEIKERYN